MECTRARKMTFSYMALCPPLANGISLAMFTNFLAAWSYFLCIHLLIMIQIIIYYFHLLLNKLFLIILHLFMHNFKNIYAFIFEYFKWMGHWAPGWDDKDEWSVSSSFWLSSNSFPVIFRHEGIENMFWNSHSVPIKSTWGKCLLGKNLLVM